MLQARTSRRERGTLEHRKEEHKPNVVLNPSTLCTLRGLGLKPVAQEEGRDRPGPAETAKDVNHPQEPAQNQGSQGRQTKSFVNKKSQALV